MRTQITALAVGATLLLTGCSSTQNKGVDPANPSSSASDPAPPSAEPITKLTPTPTPTPSSSTNARGNIVMQGGQFGTISDRSTGNVHTKFQINSIGAITCQPPSYGSPRQPENGQIIAVDIVVETTPELAESSYPKFTLSGYDFKYIHPNGTTFNGDLGTVATYSCLPDAETFPSGGMGPSEKIAAKIVLDVPAAHGTLVMKSGLKGGFEYGF